MDAKLYSPKGEESGKVKLPESIFGISWNESLVAQVIRALEANKRRGTAHAKDRSEVRGGGKKPWRQKGTGRARHGSIRSPIWRGGGITFGPRNERDYSQKMRTKALAIVLSKKLNDKGVIFVSEISIDNPKTSEAKGILNSLAKVDGFEGILLKRNNSALIVLNGLQGSIKKSFRNFSNIEVVDVKDLNALDVIRFKHIVMANAKDVLEALESRVEKKVKKESGEAKTIVDKTVAKKVSAKKSPDKPKVRIKSASPKKRINKHMAIFGRKKEESKKKQASVNASDSSKGLKKVSGDPVPFGDESVINSSLEKVVRHPRISEKGSELVEDNNAYVFDVKKDATKPEIAQAVLKIYKVKPVKVRTVSIPRKQVTMKGNNKAFKSGGKKAYVFLKKGDSIEFV
jgi:large subunit ribosomal protein L4